MHNHPSTAWMRQRARELRCEMTPHEQQLWYALRARRFSNYKFRRQVPIGRYIVDFVCFKARLIIELDGSQHVDRNARDQTRDAWLIGEGFQVMRVWNNDLHVRRDAVLDAVWQMLVSRT